MGISYFNCGGCGEIMSDHDVEGIYCDNCGNSFCEDCESKYEMEYNDKEDDTDTKNCPICECKVIQDYEIIQYCCKLLGKTKEELTEKIKVLKKLGDKVD